MADILIRVNKTKATAIVEHPITAGMVGATAKFEFDETWNRLTKKAVFRAGALERTEEIDGDVVKIPWEVLRHTAGKVLSVGIEGKNDVDLIVVPTIWATVCRIADGATAGVLASAEPGMSTGGTGGGGGGGGSSISIDTTLSKPGFAADAAAVGRRLKALEEQVGYIDEALDEIIAIQQILIGGNTV